MESIEAENPGRPKLPNRQGLYAKVAKHAEASIDTLVRLLQSNNENIRLGAARTLLDKCLPNLKAILEEPQRDPLIIQFVDPDKPKYQEKH